MEKSRPRNGPYPPMTPEELAAHRRRNEEIRNGTAPDLLDEGFDLADLPPKEPTEA